METAPHAQPARRKLADYSAEEQNDRDVLTYPQLLALRREAYLERANAMSEADRTVLAEFGVEMAKLYGPAAKLHHNALPWSVALLVLRYGEEPAHWPAALSDGDRQRMQDMRKGDPGELGAIRPIPTTFHRKPGVQTFGLEAFPEITVVEPAKPAPAPAPATVATTEG